MWTIWGPASEIKDLGVVAEHCPYCDRTTTCLVRSVCKGAHIFFVKMTFVTKETSCCCAVCGGWFPCELWRYPTLMTVREAGTLGMENLLAKTNPGLVERMQLKEQVSALGGDPRFAVAYQQLEGMRPGALHGELLKQLLSWERLEEEQRASIVQRISVSARAWQFARQIAPGFPGEAGCLAAFLAGLVVWSAFLWLPVVRDWLWGTVTVAVGCGVAAFTGHAFLGRRVRRWAREVLAPEAEHAKVPLTTFLVVVDDLPESRLGVMEELWPIKDQIDTIRAVLLAERKL